MAWLTHATVWRLENGYKEARPQTIRKIAEVLGVDPKELIKREMQPMPHVNGRGTKRAILYAHVSIDEQTKNGYSLV